MKTLQTLLKPQTAMAKDEDRDTVLEICTSHLKKNPNGSTLTAWTTEKVSPS